MKKLKAQEYKCICESLQCFSINWWTEIQLNIFVIDTHHWFVTNVGVWRCESQRNMSNASLQTLKTVLVYGIHMLCAVLPFLHKSNSTLGSILKKAFNNENLNNSNSDHDGTRQQRKTIHSGQVAVN